MKKLPFRCLPAVLLFLTGCMSVDYVGQSFDPIPEEEPVEYYTKRGEIPAGRYRIIGRAKITASWRYDKYDIREILIDEARKRGANAVALVGEKRERIGVYEREPGAPEIGDISFRSKVSTNVDGSPKTVAVLDTPADLHGEEHYRKELHLRVLFLRDRESLEQQLARRGREIDRLVKQPDPAAEEQK